MHGDLNNGEDDGDDEAPPKKRGRGRPTKAEMQAREEAERQKFEEARQTKLHRLEHMTTSIWRAWAERLLPFDHAAEEETPRSRGRDSQVDGVTGKDDNRDAEGDRLVMYSDFSAFTRDYWEVDISGTGCVSDDFEELHRRLRHEGVRRTEMKRIVSAEQLVVRERHAVRFLGMLHDRLEPNAKASRNGRAGVGVKEMLVRADFDVDWLS